MLLDAAGTPDLIKWQLRLERVLAMPKVRSDTGCQLLHPLQLWVPAANARERCRTSAASSSRQSYRLH